MKLIQLFNSRSDSIAEADGPDHRRAEAMLTDAGFTPITIPPSDPPWNVGTQAHNAFRGIDPLRALKVLLWHRNAALVCAHMESAFILLLLRRWLRFRPKIIIWELQWSPGWRYRAFLSRLAIPRADCSVVFSSSQIARTKADYGRNCSVACVPFCVDTDFFRPDAAPDSDPSVIFSCGFDAGRDFDTLLRATKGVSLPVLIKTGGGLSVDRAVHPNVRLLRQRLSFPDYRALYRQARLVVVTTRDTPNASGVTALMEAMAMGRPTIVSDNPALRDYFAPSDALRVVPVGDDLALRQAILDLWQDPTAAEAMGRRAREFAEAHFDPKLHFQRMAALFHQVIKAAASEA